MNALCPGPVRTPMLDELFASDPSAARPSPGAHSHRSVRRARGDRGGGRVPRQRRRVVRHCFDLPRRRRHLRGVRHAGMSAGPRRVLPAVVDRGGRRVAGCGQLQPSAAGLPASVRVPRFRRRCEPQPRRSRRRPLCSHPARRRPTGRPRARVHTGRTVVDVITDADGDGCACGDRLFVGLRRGGCRRAYAPRHRPATSPPAQAMRVLGPNCQGVIHVPARTIASFSNAAGAIDLHRVGRVAYVGQSGAVGGAMFDLLRERGLDTRGLGEHRQPGRCRRHRGGTTICCATPRSTSSSSTSSRRRAGATWTRWSRRARTRDKQIVALHPGATAAGRRAMQSHTGALVGERRPFELTSQNNGIVMVDDLEPMIDVALARHGGAHRAGRRIAIITTSGGAGVSRPTGAALRLAGLGTHGRHPGGRRRAAPGLCVERQPDRRHRDVRQAGREPHGRAVPGSVARPRCRPRAPGAHEHRRRGGTAAGAFDRGQRDR